MSKKAIGLTVLLVVALLLLGTTVILLRKNSESQYQSRNVVLTGVIAGDSISLGVGASSVERSFPSILNRSRLPDGRTLKFDVVARGGATASELSEFASRRPPVSALNVLIVEAGTNDVGRSPPSEFRKAYMDMLSQVEKGVQPSLLICVGAWGLPRNVESLDTEIARICSSRNGVYVQISDLYVVSSLRGDFSLPGRVVDYFHPNDAGHSAIASRITDSLASLP